MNLGGDKPDTAGPFLVAAPLVKKATGEPVTVQVYTTDKSGVAKVEAKAGVCSDDSADWVGAVEVKGSFKAEDNGWYSVRAMDRKGNYNIRYVNIDNYDPNVSEAPSVNKFTNKMTELTGKASPAGEVHVFADGMEYTVKADAEGKFSVTLP